MSEDVKLGSSKLVPAAATMRPPFGGAGAIKPLTKEGHADKPGHDPQHHSRLGFTHASCEANNRLMLPWRADAIPTH